jgi:hypothetical protein
MRLTATSWAKPSAPFSDRPRVVPVGPHPLHTAASLPPCCYLITGRTFLPQAADCRHHVRVLHARLSAVVGVRHPRIDGGPEQESPAGGARAVDIVVRHARAGGLRPLQPDLPLAPRCRECGRRCRRRRTGRHPAHLSSDRTFARWVYRSEHEIVRLPVRQACDHRIRPGIRPQFRVGATASRRHLHAVVVRARGPG